MKNLMLMLGDAIPEPMLLSMIEDFIKKYKGDPSEENSIMLMGGMQMFMSKKISDKIGLEKLMSDMESLEKSADFFKLNKQ